MFLRQPVGAQFRSTATFKARSIHQLPHLHTGATAFGALRVDGMAPSALLSQLGSQVAPAGCRVVAGSRRPALVCRLSSAQQSIRCSNHAVRKTLEPVRAAAVSIFVCVDNFVHDRAGLGAHPCGSSVWVVQAFSTTPSPCWGHAVLDVYHKSLLIKYSTLSGLFLGPAVTLP